MRFSGSRASEIGECAAPVIVSAALHSVILIALVSAEPPKVAAPVPEQSFQVETASPRQFDAILHPAPLTSVGAVPVAPPPSGSDAAASAPASSPSPRPWRHATQMLSAAALDDPGNKTVAPKLARVEPNTRREQICDFEAILQIGRMEPGFTPDSVVAYAMRET